MWLKIFIPAKLEAHGTSKKYENFYKKRDVFQSFSTPNRNRWFFKFNFEIFSQYILINFFETIYKCCKNMNGNSCVFNHDLLSTVFIYKLCLKLFFKFSDFQLLVKECFFKTIKTWFHETIGIKPLNFRKDDTSLLFDSSDRIDKFFDIVNNQICFYSLSIKWRWI